MRVPWRTAIACVLAAAAIAACAPQPQVATPQPPAAAGAPSARAGVAVPLRALTLVDAYKKLVARRIVQRTRDVYAEPMPEVMKSVVVLDVTIDRVGNLVEASVYRSNGEGWTSSTASPPAWTGI